MAYLLTIIVALALSVLLGLVIIQIDKALARRHELKQRIIDLELRDEDA